MPRIAGILSILIALACSTILQAAENRTPTPEEIREQLRRYNESGKVSGLQRTPLTPKSVEQFNRAVSLHSKKDASARDLKEAAELYQAAAEGGIPQASTNLALLYLEGKGVRKDVKKALSLLNAAAARNDSQADIALARLYLTGQGVKKDEKKGEALLNKAAKGGNQNAAKMLAEYKEWKRKNELAMKQYQDLMKQVQLAQKKPGTPAAMPPLQLFPQSPAGRAPSAIPFPVIPGYGYVSDRKPALPNFMAQASQQSSQALNILPQGTGTRPVPQPISVVSQGNTSATPLKTEVGPAPVTVLPAAPQQQSTSGNPQQPVR